MKRLNQPTADYKFVGITQLEMYKNSFRVKLCCMEITKEKALETLKRWHDKEKTVALWFAASGGTAVSTMVAQIRVVSPNVVFQSENSMLSFALNKARFEYGPLEFLRFPQRAGLTQINGMHIYLESGNRLFICDDWDKGERWSQFLDAMLKAHAGFGKLKLEEPVELACEPA